MDIYADGGASMNPGPSGIAFLFVDDGKIVYAQFGFIGEATNNIAEYKSVIKALQSALRQNILHVNLFSDKILD